MENRIDVLENEVGQTEENVSSVKEQIEERVSAVEQQVDDRVSAVAKEVERRQGMRRPIALKKDGIQTRNRKISSRTRKRKCQSPSDDRSYASRDYMNYSSVQQMAPIASYMDHENLPGHNSYVAHTSSASSSSNCNNSFSHIQHSSYGFPPYPQTMVGSLT
ncbi:hypothetical protein X975_09896, partial [Stegodyphus mimosarum]